MAGTTPAPAPTLPWERILDAHADGVRVVQRLGSKFVDWGLPTACAGWNALDVAGHVLCIARYYHRILDAALAGSPLRELPRGEALAAFNAGELAELGIAGGADRIVAFDAVATRYGERLADVDPGLPLGVWSGSMTLTVREHTMLAAGEWHVHAWDLAGALGWDYRAADPEVLLAGRSLLPGAIAPGDPWKVLLEVTGRRDTPRPRPAGP